MNKLLLLGICIALLPLFTLSGIKAQPPCSDVCLEGQYQKYGNLISPGSNNWKWIPDYCDGHGVWLQEPADNSIFASAD